MMGRPSFEEQEGFALLAVMLGLVVIGILALGMVLATRSGTQEAHDELQASEATAFCDAIILQTSVALLDPTEQNRPRIDDVPQSIDVLGQKVFIIVDSEFGKVDLNAADADTLAGLFEAVGEGPDEADAEAGQIVAWRIGVDANGDPHLFRTVDEITQVPGMTQSLYTRIYPAVTVYSGRGRIDQSTAPLLALEAVPGMDHLTAQAIIRERDRNQTEIGSGEVFDGKLIQGISMTGWAFMIKISFILNRKQQAADAVIRMTGDPDRPYFTLWREQGSD